MSRARQKCTDEHYCCSSEHTLVWKVHLGSVCTNQSESAAVHKSRPRRPRRNTGPVLDTSNLEVPPNRKQCFGSIGSITIQAVLYSFDCMHVVASSLASLHPAPPIASRLASLAATPLMAPPPVSHPTSAPVPLAQHAKVIRRSTPNLHATVHPSLCGVHGPSHYSHKRRRTGSPHRARPVQGRTPGVSVVQVPTAAAHSLSVLRTDASCPSGR